MKPADADVYVCPRSRQPMRLRIVEEVGGELVSGAFVSEDGSEYPIKDGVPDLTYPRELDKRDANVRTFYDGRGDAYDANLYLTFKTHGEDEQKSRNQFVDLLGLQPSFRVLEVACGTGRDSEIISARLGTGGRLYLTDLSPGMLMRCRKRLASVSVSTSFSLSNAGFMPYRDRYFDAVYSFGG